MSKLEKLIAKLCSNGVEYKKLGDAAEIGRGYNVDVGILTMNVYDFLLAPASLRR